MILAVEDVAANVALLEAILLPAGHVVRCAASIQEALDAIGEERPQLILLDVRLPGENGLELAVRLKADADTARIPIVAVSAGAMQSERQRALTAGCDDFLAKPFRARELIDMVQRHLRTDTSPES